LQYSFLDHGIAGFSKDVGIDALIKRSSVRNFHFQRAHRSEGVTAEHPEKAGSGDFDALFS
jgi:hypothetical protein